MGHLQGSFWRNFGGFFFSYNFGHLADFLGDFFGNFWRDFRGFLGVFWEFEEGSLDFLRNFREDFGGILRVFLGFEGGLRTGFEEFWKFSGDLKGDSGGILWGIFGFLGRISGRTLEIFG